MYVTIQRGMWCWFSMCFCLSVESVCVVCVRGRGREREKGVSWVRACMHVYSIWDYVLYVYVHVILCVCIHSHDLQFVCSLYICRMYECKRCVGGVCTWIYVYVRIYVSCGWVCFSSFPRGVGTWWLTTHLCWPRVRDNTHLLSKAASARNSPLSWKHPLHQAVLPL